MKEFEKFVYSPFHNNRSEVVRYFEILKKYYPDFTIKELTKEFIFSRLYPTSEYRDDVMRRLSSNLLKLGEEFAAYTNFRNDKYRYEKSILDFFRSKGADKFFLRQYEKIKSQIEEQTFRDTEYYYRSGELDELFRTFMMKYDPNYRKVSFKTQIDLQWKYVLSSMMRLYGFAEYEKYFHNKNYELKFKDVLLNLAEDSGFLNSKTVEIYYLLLKLYEGSQTGGDIRKLIETIDDLSECFEKSELFQFYIHLFNYINICKLKSDKDFSSEEFEIARKMSENDLLLHNGKIDPGWFRGIFSKAVNAEELEFAGEFIEKFKNVVDGAESESVVNHVYANLEIQKKNYESALKYLEKAAYLHLNDKWSVKNMYLTIYYELNDYEGFINTSDSIKHLIKESGQWSDNMIIPIRNFLNISARLLRKKLGEEEISLDEIKHRTLNSNVRARKWLLKKIEELEKMQPTV
ncbi:MAG: hypothetical protein JSS91_13440 [Bacteroidetes bacterium]|nr:hypothetical protein [Bacteroidota bacterium]